MLDEIDFLINKIEINQQEKLEFEISALQSQINPHFIYNTLSTIRWMAIIQGNNSIVKMLDAFINLMKYCSNFKESLITLKNEKSFLEEYVYIQNVRYNSSIYITMDFEKDTLKCKILKFILQPLVENSVFHGFSSQCQQREIRIVAKILNDKLIIEVIDNGQGIKQEILEDILSHKNNDNGLTGIGINNVCRRIQAKFGEEYGLSISSIPNQGCTVKVVLPIIL
jgi:two-component system sensor histidine kinase YesM